VSAPTIETLADLVDRLGGIPLDRIRFQPSPGSATEADVLAALEAPRKRLCELVEGVLVEKAMGHRESALAAFLSGLLNGFVIPRNLGIVTGADGTVRLFPGLVRIPDVAFTSWDRLPGRRMPTTAIPTLAPNLAVEVLSASNTSGEMARKRADYFAAGAQLVWQIDPAARSVSAYSDVDKVRVLGQLETLDGGAVLPGFVLVLGDLFAELDLQG
jgi:Uma2 family endonuclease